MEFVPNLGMSLSLSGDVKEALKDGIATKELVPTKVQAEQVQSSGTKKACVPMTTSPKARRKNGASMSLKEQGKRIVARMWPVYDHEHFTNRQGKGLRATMLGALRLT